MIRIKTTRNTYKDIVSVDIISNDNIQVFLDIPENIPMERLRQSATDATAETENLFFYDILPVIGYAQFADQVEKDDILIRKIYTDTSSSTPPYLLILQVAEIIGNIRHNFVQWKKFNCAPYTLALPKDVSTIISQYNDDSEL